MFAAHTRSALLGAILTVGMTPFAFAADAVISLDVCDSLGLSGLTISSDTTCLQISGAVSYRFAWGDFKEDLELIGPFPAANDDEYEVPDGNGIADWESEVKALLGLTAISSSDFGPAAAHIVFEHVSQIEVYDGVFGYGRDDTSEGGDGGSIEIEEAWVSVGDQTMLMVGRKDTIFNYGTDEPYNFLGLFNSDMLGEDEDPNEPFGRGRSPSEGVWFNAPYDPLAPDEDNPDLRFGGASIQLTHKFAEGFYAGIGLENIDDDELERAGTLVGVVGYDGESLTAHVSGAAGGVLDGEVEWFGVHAGAELRFEQIKLLASVAANNLGWVNGLASAVAELDMFTIAVSGEVTASPLTATQVGFGGSIGAQVTEQVALNAGFRWFDPDVTTAGDDGLQAALQANFAATETITLVAEVGAFVTGPAAETPDAFIPYGALEIGWAPGGDLVTAVRGEAFGTDGTPGFKLEFKASKAFGGGAVSAEDDDD